MTEGPVAQQIIDAAHSRVTLTIDGEEYEGYVDHVDYAPYENHPRWPEDGEIDATFELSNDEFDRRGLSTTQVDIRAKETAPGEWEEPNAAVWDPEVEDGVVQRDDWTGLGTVEAVEPREGGDA